MARVSPNSKCCQSSPRCARCPARLLCATCPNAEPDTNTLVAEIFHGGGPPRDLPLAVRKQLAGLAAMHL